MISVQLVLNGVINYFRLLKYEGKRMWCLKLNIRVLLRISQPVLICLAFAAGSQSFGSNSFAVDDPISRQPLYDGQNLDIDGNQQFDALTDGLLILRYLFGLTDYDLIKGVVAEDANFKLSSEIEGRLLRVENLLDIDESGHLDALTDGLIILRYLFGMRGDLMLSGAISENARRQTPSEIENYLRLTLNHKPVFETESYFLINENSIAVGQIQAVDYDSDAIVFSLSGEDPQFFNIDSVSGLLSFNSSPDYESPKNSKLDNIYQITILASDLIATATSEILVEVSNVPEFSVTENYALPVENVDITLFEEVTVNYSVEEVMSSEGRLWGFKFLNDSMFIVSEQEGIFHVADYDGNPISSINLNEHLNLTTVGQGGLFNFEIKKRTDHDYVIYFLASELNYYERSALTLFKIDLSIDGPNVFFSEPFKLFQTTHRFGGHYGGDIEIVGDQMFVSSGERTCRSCAQDLSNYLGKILRFRILENGQISPHPDNALRDTAKSEIFSFGHRNPQGLAVVEEFGFIISSEHGPQGGDEINLIENGVNYGWPLVSTGEEYGGGVIGQQHIDGFRDGLTYYIPSLAPREIHYVEKNSLFPNLNNKVLLASLKYDAIVVVDVNRDIPQHKIFSLSPILGAHGRISGLDVNSIGEIYFATNSEGGKVYKITSKQNDK